MSNEKELAAIVKQMRALAGGSWSASASAIRLWADDLEAIAARSAREAKILAAANELRDRDSIEINFNGKHRPIWEAFVDAALERENQ